MICVAAIDSRMMPESKKPNDVSMFCDVVVDLLRPIICFIISGIDCLISIWVEQVSVASGFGLSHSPSAFSSSMSMSSSGRSSDFRMSSLFTQLGKFPLSGSTHPHRQSGQAMYCTALTPFASVITFPSIDTDMLVCVAPLKKDKLQVCIPKIIYLLMLKKSSQFDLRVTEAFKLKSYEDMAQ